MVPLGNAWSTAHSQNPATPANHCGGKFKSILIIRVKNVSESKFASGNIQSKQRESGPNYCLLSSLASSRREKLGNFDTNCCWSWSGMAGLEGAGPG